MLYTSILDLNYQALKILVLSGRGVSLALIKKYDNTKNVIIT